MRRRLVTFDNTCQTTNKEHVLSIPVSDFMDAILKHDIPDGHISLEAFQSGRRTKGDRKNNLIQALEKLALSHLPMDTGIKVKVEFSRDGLEATVTTKIYNASI